MEDYLPKIVGAVVLILVTHFGTSKADESTTNKVMETYAEIIQQQAKLLESCK